MVSSALAAIPPLVEQLRSDLPDAEVLHFVDEGLLVEFARAGGLSRRARVRTLKLVLSAEAAGCDAIVSSCSTLTPAFTELASFVKVPIVTVDRDMFRAACEEAGRIMVLTTAESVLTSVLTTLREAANAVAREPEVMTTVVTAATSHPLGSGEALRAIATEVEKALTVADVAVLGQCSMIGCLQYVPESLRPRVLCAPPYAVRAVREALQQRTRS
jgi:Asp/Glu/hydantoin racemase